MPFPFITKPAPAFTSTALMPNKEFKEISLSDYRGKWVVFFWYPLDFTFVCPTEIIAFGDRADEFAAINTQVIGASCDSQFTHLAWVNTPRSEGGLGDMKIPIIADFTKKVATDYGVLVPDAGIPFRAVFIINPEGVLRQITVNDLPVGRNVDEIIRLIKAFQFVDEHGEVCPANWQPGDLTMKADPNASKEYFHAANAGAAAAGGAKTAYVEITDKAGFSTATSSAGLTVVDYWAPWCKNCSKIAPAVDNLAASLAGTKFVKVNTNLAVDLAAENGVGSLPSFQFFKGGKKVGEYTGSNVTLLEAAIKSHL